MTEDFSNRGTGYLINQENHEFLLANAQSANQFTFGNIDPRNMGKSMGLIDILQLEDQKQESSCAGHASTTIAEAIVFMDSGQRVQLSRNFAYVNGQRYCGISGDSGCTLEGIIKGAGNDGFPLEQYWAYTGQYSADIPDVAKMHAKEFKLKSWAPIKELQEIYEGLARRVGGIFMGIPCTQEIFQSPADGRLEQYFPTNAGGHALPIVDWCDDIKDENGYPYFVMPNSWGPKYGYRGCRFLRPSAVVSMMRARNSSFYLLSSMEYLKPNYNWESQKWLA